ncbi:uncharacterized protein LY89DRAFT_380662 [Mollisia scopiformis]|uniref:Zn(2)-C6 fungal-type domain-containing protein n=1 Tax=Mollisia scopiformis TaxID=149040 RepID=A0A194XPM6_MOLSC|nr:uncharacterized protein LY89DRAFT_380662 [Mollisia scopiformis]KUJ21692.1 hypothetical protein LY89DRAFT_380662 [Mollisia scopiformis]
MLSTTSGQQTDAGPLPPPPAYKITRGHSCILCQQRKVRCDRQKPCANCIKARAECVPSAPTLPRRRRRKLAETDIAGRLKRAEQLLRSHGVKIDDEEADEVHEEMPYSGRPEQDRTLALAGPRRRDHSHGALFKDKENSHYVESTLWENLRDEIQDPKDALQGSSDSDETNETGLYPHPEALLVGFGSQSADLSTLHPLAVQIFRLWQTFLVNVNPLVKMFHAPTIQQLILDASGNLENIPRHTEALIMFGASRPQLLAKYSHGTQQALINARFLKSLNILTLQSLVLYLLGVRKAYDPHSLWILTGVCVRISQRLGLHRDGSNHKISPFDAEIRRRTWWQIVFLDGHSSKLAGAGFPAWLAKFDTKIPLNISDSDMSPTMKEPPKEKEGATEMLFCCLRYETAQALRSARKSKGKDGGWHIAPGPEVIPEKDKAIDELEIRFEEKFIRFCDPSIPLHLLAIYIAKSVICTMRIMAHHPRQYPDKGASMPQKEKDMLFSESLKELEYDSLGHTTKSIQGFLWHITSHFQFDAFIYIISELRHRTDGDLVDRAWQQVIFSYEHRPEMITDTKNALYVAIGNLTLKAWQKREDTATGTYQVPPPRFISQLRAQRNIPDPPLPRNATPPERQDHIARQNLITTFSNNVPQNMTYNNTAPDGWSHVDYGFDVNMNMTEITPVDWEYWQTLMDGDLPPYTGGGSGGGGADNNGQWFS